VCEVDRILTLVPEAAADVDHYLLLAIRYMYILAFFTNNTMKDDEEGV
jgi:hypothetical protein